MCATDCGDVLWDGVRTCHPAGTMGTDSMCFLSHGISHREILPSYLMTLRPTVVHDFMNTALQLLVKDVSGIATGF